MSYPEQMVAPMRADLTTAGFQELLSPEEVSNILSKKEGTTLLVVNSVCGCAAGAARPGVKMSLEGTVKPEHLVTVFAGQEVDAVNEARKFLFPYPPSSPAIALFKNGELVHMIERHHIEGRPAQMISDHLKMTYEEYCK